MVAGETIDVGRGREGEEFFRPGQVVGSADGPDTVGEESLDGVVDRGGITLIC